MIFLLSVAKFKWMNSKSIMRRKKTAYREKSDIRMNMAYDLCNKNANSLTEISLDFNRFAFSTIYIWSVNYRPNVIIGLISDDSDRIEWVRKSQFRIEILTSVRPFIHFLRSSTINLTDCTTCLLSTQWTQWTKREYSSKYTLISHFR